LNSLNCISCIQTLHNLWLTNGTSNGRHTTRFACDTRSHRPQWKTASTLNSKTTQTQNIKTVTAT
jgi:hypothetical protein